MKHLRSLAFFVCSASLVGLMAQPDIVVADCTKFAAAPSDPQPVSVYSFDITADSA